MAFPDSSSKCQSDDQWISKKDLLAVTGISYGQLYRWKRERLIPDSWFDKRSAFTGQETYFPRALILERIHFILENKDRYTLPQLAELISPNPKGRRFAPRHFDHHPEFFPGVTLILKLTGQHDLDYGQALAALIASEPGNLSEGEREFFCSCLLSWPLMAEPDASIALIRRCGTLFPLYMKPESCLMLPKDAQTLYTLSLNRLPADYQPRLNALAQPDDEIPTKI